MIFEEPPTSREQVVIRQTDRALANDVLRSLQADGTATEPDVRPPRHGPSGANLLFTVTVSTSRRCRHRIRTRIKSHIDSSVCDCYWYGR